MSQTYTIKELSNKCNCSIPTITKRLKALNLKPLKCLKQGKKIKAYSLSDEDLKTLNNNENIEKGFKDDLKPLKPDYEIKYFQCFQELIEVKTKQKLLVDNLNNEKALYLNEVNKLTKQNNDLITKLDKATQTSYLFKIITAIASTLAITVTLIYFIH